MPVIELSISKLEEDKKKELIKGLSEVASKATGIDISHFVVFINEYDAESIGTGGKPLKEVLGI